MKRFYFITMLMCFCGIAAMAQTPAATPGPATTAGPACRVTLTGTKPGKNADFIKFQREDNKPMFDEQKRQGLILSYATTRSR